MSRESKPEYIVVRYQPGRRWWHLAVLLLCTVVAAAGGYVLGQAQGQAQGDFRVSSIQNSRNSQLEAVQSLKSRLTETQQEVVNFERGRSIDAEALNQARRSIVELETIIMSLQADLTFYKNIMAPSDVSRGLQVDQLTVRSSPNEEHFLFKLVLTQVGDNKNFIAGVVVVNIIGQRGDEKEIIALRDLSPDVEDLGVKFRFRYFQDIEGRVLLPEGFEPIEVQVVAQSQGHKPTQSEKTFEWRKVTES